MSENKKYKSSLFSILFNNPEKAMELYNALAGTNYTDPTKVQITTLDDVLFMDRVNDLSFMIDDKLIILIEHQSTINNNMPLRLFMYLARVYEKIMSNDNIYREKLIKIPTPECYVLYNGEADYPDKTIMKLSDAYIEKKSKYPLELEVEVLNVNSGKNADIIEKSKTLYGYSRFIQLVRANQAKNMKLNDAIISAIKECEQEHVLEQELKKLGSEEINMLMTEFDLDTALRIRKEEGREEGREEGKAEGREEGKAEGRKETKNKVICNLKALGIPQAMIDKAVKNI